MNPSFRSETSVSLRNERHLLQLRFYRYFAPNSATKLGLIIWNSNRWQGADPIRDADYRAARKYRPSLPASAWSSRLNRSALRSATQTRARESVGLRLDHSP